MKIHLQFYHVQRDLVLEYEFLEYKPSQRSPFDHTPVFYQVINGEHFHQ